MRLSHTNKYFPSNYSSTLICAIIKNHVENLPLSRRDILLFGYPSADNHPERDPDDFCFPRIIDEMKSIENALGPIRICLYISDEE